MTEVTKAEARNAEFIIRTGEHFWLDSDGKNRWHWVESDENPSYGESHCQACGHYIQNLFAVSHEVVEGERNSGRFAIVGSECIHKLALTASEVDRAKMFRAIALAEERTKARRAAQKAEALETLANESVLKVNYSPGQRSSISESLRWYAERVRAGKTYRDFEKRLRASVERYGLVWPIGRAKRGAA